MEGYLAILLLAAAIGLHFWWRNRFRKERRQAARQAEEIEELRSREQRAATSADAQWEALFNSMAEGVLLADAKGRIRLVNVALKKLMDLSAAPLGRTILEAFRLHELAELAERAGAGESVKEFDLELSSPQKRALHVNAAPVRGRDGNFYGVILVFHDLTRLKQLENTRREFVANVSHELRTPLALIKGCVETLVDGAKDDPEVALKFLKIISKHSDRLALLIDDLLTISEMEAGGTAMNVQRIELHSVAREVCEDLQARALSKATRLRNELPPGLFALGDPDRIQQVFFNLLDNAIKYGRSEGIAKISGRTGKSGWIEVRVEDDGPGIPPDAKERVFERFFRLDRARSREQGGTGLGLSIVKHIVQSHSGEVWVQSEIGKGSTFGFTLPAAPEPEPKSSGN